MPIGTLLVAALRGSIRVYVLAAALVIPGGCSYQLRQEVQSAAVGGRNANGDWYLLVPPQRIYSSDRTTMMGGPLATAPSNEFPGALGTYNLMEIDENEPLNRWERAMQFPSKRDCEDYKTAQLKQISDPLTSTKIALKTRIRLVDTPYMRSYVESGRCVSAADLGAR